MYINEVNFKDVAVNEIKNNRMKERLWQRALTESNGSRPDAKR